jgi:hypothetical protein
MLGFMPNDTHRHIPPDCATEKGRAEQRFFANTPPIFFRFAFVYYVQEKSENGR